MSNIKQEITFVGCGMDTDTDLRYVANGDGRANRNILVGGDESNGILINMFGNTRTVDISEHELYLSHYYKVIGSYYNRLQRAIYYFVFSQPYEIGTTTSSTSTTTTTTSTTESGNLVIDYTSGSFQYDNMLLRYWEDTQTLDIIFRDTKNYFGLHYNYPMRDVTMIGNWLYFTPRVSEPKMIEVEMAYNYTNYDAYDPTLAYIYGDYVTFYGGLFRANVDVGVGETPSTTTTKWDRIGDSYQNESSLQNLDSEFRYAFNVIKSPPRDRISYSYESDANIHFNNVRGRVFKFTHRYQYFDNSYSVFSAYSDITLPIEDELYDGEVTDITELHNFIRVSFSPFSSALVRYIEVFFQELGTDTWRRCKIVNRREQAILDYTANFTYDFYNNEAYEAFADSTQVAKVADSVPQKANSQEIINKNILCYGGCTEGFDNIPKEDIDVTLTPETVELTVNYVPDLEIRNNITIVGDITYNEGDGYYYTKLLVGSWYTGVGLNDGDYYQFAFTVGSTEYAGQLRLTAAMLASDDALATGIRAAFFAQGFLDVVFDANNDLELRSYTFQYPTFSISKYFSVVTSIDTLTKGRSFKSGAFHPFCIYYYDESMRRWDAQTSKISIASTGYSYDGTTVYVPMLNEISPTPADNAYRWVIDWSVNHLPPTGAKYWRWGYAGNGLCSYFVQYIVKDIAQGTAENANMVAIDIEPLQTLKSTVTADWNQFPHSAIDAYTWQKGDRIRFITQKPANIAAPGTRLGDLVEGVYDYEIIKQDTTLNIIYTQYFDHTVVGLNLDENSLVEIYRPVKSTEKLVYYEFGDLMPVIEDSEGVLVHSGGDSTKNQSTATDTPATGTFDAGDVYVIYRTPSKPLCTSVGELVSSAFHESQWYSDFYVSDFWDQGKTGVESDFNKRSLKIIRYSNQYLENTKINGLPTFEALSYKALTEVFGDIIAIYELGDTLKCYQERKASSIGIGRTDYTDADGNKTVAISTSVLGSIRYSPSNFSTVFPESIARNNKFIYGFDIYNGIVFRDSVNGIFPISGRYSEAGVDANYKMAHYFKDKSKALLVSGIEYCDVMSVWDEEYKNLYVVFRDYVNEDNNETIVFHEPSNRWICFMDLDQTPPYHNEILELTYWIKQGFEGGIGYSFDEDTRFAVFDILTPTGFVVVSPDAITMNMTPYAPDTTGDSLPDSNIVNMAMTVYAPTVYISYVHASLGVMYFADTDFGFDIAQTTTIDCVPSTCTVTAKPSWVTIMGALSELYSVGSTVLDNAVLYIFPATENEGETLIGDVVLTNSYGDSATISIVQAGSAAVEYTLTITLDPTDTSGMTLSSATGYFLDGTPSVFMTFTPDHPDYSSGQAFNMSWTSTKNGVYAGEGDITAYDEVSNVEVPISLFSNIIAGDVVIIYLSGV